MMEDDRVVLLSDGEADSAAESSAAAHKTEQRQQQQNGGGPPEEPDGDSARSRRDESSREPAPIVYVAACVAAVGGVLFGYDMGVISGAKRQMQEDLSLSCAQVSAVVAMLPVGGFLASLVGGVAVDKYGRRTTIIANALFFTLGALLIAATSSFSLILLGRFILGFAVSLSAIAECIYISEISTPERRGALVSLNELGITVGILVSFLVNYIFAECPSGWRYAFALSAAVAVAQGAAMAFLPRTPQFLVICRRDREAEAALRRLNITGDVRQTMADIRHSLADQQHSARGCLGFVRLLAANADNLGSRLLIGCGLVLLQQFSGQPNIMYFAADVFRQVGFCSEMSATLAAVGLGMLKVASTAVSLSLVDRIGRRRALVVGITVMATSIAALAFYSFEQDSLAVEETCVEPLVNSSSSSSNFKSSSSNSSMLMSLNNSDSSSSCSEDSSSSSQSKFNRYFAFTALVSFVCAYSFSFGPVTWVILSEIFPAATKGRAMALATSLNWAGNAFVSATFLDATATFTLGGVFLSYSIVCLIAIAFVVSVVPETKNKSLEEISKELKANYLVQCLPSLPATWVNFLLQKQGAGEKKSLSKNV